MILKKAFLVPLLIVALVTAETCEYREYCVRHRESMLTSLKDPSGAVQYSLDPDSIEIDNKAGLLKGHLTGETVNLELNAWLYQEGIMRVLIGEKDSDRFRIS